MPCEVVPMEEAHLPQVTAIEAATFSDPWSENAFREEIHNPRALFLVAVAGSRVLGYLGLQRVLDEGYITNVAVAAPARRQGVGKALMQAAVDYARRESLSLLTLEVRVSNAPAIALYNRYGFAALGRRRNFYRFPREDAYVMTLTLEQQERKLPYADTEF